MIVILKGKEECKRRICKQLSVFAKVTFDVVAMITDIILQLP